MGKCPHMRRPTEERAVCGYLSDLSGFTRSVSRAICGRCIAAGAPEDSWAMMEKLLIEGLIGRLLGGDCPRYQNANPVDLHDAFGRLAPLIGQTRQADVIKRMFRFQAAIRESDGGHPSAVLAQKLTALAAEYDDANQHLTRALQEAIADHAEVD